MIGGLLVMASLFKEREVSKSGKKNKLKIKNEKTNLYLVSFFGFWFYRSFENVLWCCFAFASDYHYNDDSWIFHSNIYNIYNDCKRL